MSAAPTPLLEVRDLVVRFPAPRGGRRTPAAHAGEEEPPVVAGVSFDVRPGETLGLIGESGAGKTLSALSLLRLVPRPGRITAGSIQWRGRELLSMPEAELRTLRGGEIGMIFQDPVAALHPMLRIDEQVAEALLTHAPETPRSAAMGRAAELLEHLGVPAARIRHAPYPHQWSGGMCQRAMLAMAIANRPALLIADEPTTALDAATRDDVLGLLERLREEFSLAILLITHELEIVARMADRVAVMQQGRIVDTGPVRELLERPSHPYTAELVARARPRAARVDRVRARTDGRSAAELPSPERAVALAASNLRVTYRIPGSRELVHAVEDASLTVQAGETVGLVGASGAGKSSLARALLRLTPVERGTIRLGSTDLTSLSGAALRRARAEIQIVFQNPYASLNPRRTVGESIAEPLRIHGRYGRDGTARVATLLEEVQLPAAYATRFPQELSGGERQRVAIARALVLEPRVVVLDEPVTSLDAATRTGILDLLEALQEKTGVGYLFIAHDLDVIRRLAHRVLLMSSGTLAQWEDKAPSTGRVAAPAVPPGVD